MLGRSDQHFLRTVVQHQASNNRREAVLPQIGPTRSRERSSFDITGDQRERPGGGANQAY